MEFSKTDKAVLVILTALLLWGVLKLNYRYFRPSEDIAFMKKDIPYGLSMSEVRDMIDENRKVNINTAGIKELTLIPGIGEKTAERIISYRMSYGPFTASEDLMNIRGLGEKKVEKMRPYIKLSLRCKARRNGVGCKVL